MSDVLISAAQSLLAQSAAQVAEPGAFDWQAYAIWTAVVVFLVGATLILLRYVRRSTIEAETDAAAPLFDLGELCELRDRGELTQEQYERLSDAALAAIPPLSVLTELRELRDSGRLRVPDYDKLRARAVERIKTGDATVAKPAPAE